jgi:hypothetical protein
MKLVVGKEVFINYFLINGLARTKNSAMAIYQVGKGGKLIHKWKEFLKFEISNNSLNELKSDIESFDRFDSGDFLNKYISEEDKYNFLTLLYEVVGYVDQKAYNKQVYNQYEDKRTLASTGIYQNDWVKSLVNYKK